MGSNVATVSLSFIAITESIKSIESPNHGMPTVDANYNLQFTTTSTSTAITDEHDKTVSFQS